VACKGPVHRQFLTAGQNQVRRHAPGTGIPVFATAKKPLGLGLIGRPIHVMARQTAESAQHCNFLLAKIPGDDPGGAPYRYSAMQGATVRLAVACLGRLP
jgi:hypothetical protein